MNIIRITLLVFLAGLISTSLEAKAFLQGIVSFLNSGSRPAIGVKISAVGANPVYTTSSGMFTLEFPNKQPGDKVKIIIGSTDEKDTPLVLVNDKVVADIRIPSRPDDDIIEIIVCNAKDHSESVMRYNGLLIKSINENTDKRLMEIDKKIDILKINAETIASLQKEKVKLLTERDSALSKVKEQATFIANINSGH